MKIVSLLILSFILVVNGCGESNKTEKLTAEQPTSKEMKINYSDFDLLANHIEKTLFEYDLEITRGDPKKLGEPYAVHGKYDLNSDGIVDKIQVNFSALSAAYGIGESSKIKINDTEVESYFDNPRGVYIVDFNVEDSFKELIVFDDGRSGDPGIFIYRYNGEEIIELGRIGGEIWWYEKPDEAKDDILKPWPSCSIKIDARGRILSSWDIIDFVSPEIVLGVREIKDNKIEYIKVDNSVILNKEYEINENFTAYFIETEKEIKDFIVSWDKDKITSFKQGDKIYLKDICDEFGGRYIIELENGKRGILCFWIGD